MDETTPVRPVLNEIAPEIDPKLTPSQPATSGDTRSQSLRAEIRAEIRDDILVEDLAPRSTDPIDEPKQSRDRNFEQAIELLEHYSFDIEGGSARSFVTYWAGDLPSEWLRLAVLEALYQGRYKAVSVSQILTLWERKQQPQTHFNAEFESLICDRLFAEVEAEVEVTVAETAIEKDPAALSEGSETQAESSSKPMGDLISDVTPVRLPDISSPSHDTIAPQPIPENTEDTAQPGESDSSSLNHQRSHPTQIAQFVPEGESHVYDKLRDLARAGETEEESAPPPP